ncbi:CIC11C00000000193 [Sungouiella intermedia]|uniref:Carboxylic ester hydrolase n=1 Tax=Sungouiella intermedia TaxID=45354 RepID=A0A1L0DQB5_9ASCO|nr:CIC11C00000000193 [[Candida] intermedia]
MGQTVSAERSLPHTISIPGHGLLTGYLLRSSSGNITSYRYGNVPYAVPQGASGRFKKPVPIPGSYDLTGDYYDLGLKCPQPAVENPVFNYVKSPSTEDVQYVNIWVPSSDKYKPAAGWPVLVYIHGGWLQYGTPSLEIFNISDLHDDEELQKKFILVSVGYRLNIFGFLSSKELLEEDEESANFGFWDQRLALEWTYKYIKYFGGNPQQITLAGLSAGAYSTFFQLTYELYHPEVPQIIKQAVLFSNTPLSQPKTIDESQAQFDEVIDKLGIDKTLSGLEKLMSLRKLDSDYLEGFIPSLQQHTFRAVSDGKFVPFGFIRDLTTGEYARKLTKKQFRFISGEVDNEQYTYSLMYSPTTIENLKIQVNNYYPEKVARKLLELYVDESLNEKDPDFIEKVTSLYGKIISDGQVYVSSRGFLNQLVKNGFPSSRIFRYRVSYRPKCVDNLIAKEHKVPHGVDTYVWFYPLREGFSEKERTSVRNWIRPYIEFLSYEEAFDWDNSDLKKLKYFRDDGAIEYLEDSRWDWSIKVADAVYEAQLE